ncbi:MAG: UDP-3-O-(3-hydroxymyristoyl)glucosamine N-acyltransferase [Planctomycetaceae bacterium]|nr:UDP-3-O-(3-hydroxymyristoyl)glucosamine N-acyltransferase [Planctomycetaceae bacterium]
MAAQSIHALTAGEIASLLDAELIGSGDAIVSGTNFIERASATELAFVGCSKNASRIEDTAAVVIIAPPDLKTAAQDDPERTYILTERPEDAFLTVAQKICPTRPESWTGVSPQASIAATAKIGRNTTVCPFAVIGEHVSIGEDCHIGPGAVIGSDCHIGDNTRIDAQAVLYAGTQVGSDVTINAGTVLGAEGFGYSTVNGQHRRLPHVGHVVIEDDVEIGACTTVDRAKMGATVIGSGTRIDNQVMVGHNCQIGKHNLIVSQVGLAGSCSTGAYVVLAGQAGIADHVHLGDGAIVGAKSGVHRDMPGGKTYLGSPATEAAEQAKIVTSLRRLPQLRKTIKELQQQVATLQSELAQAIDSLGDQAAREAA